MDKEKIREAIEMLKQIIDEAIAKGNSPMVFIGEQDRPKLQVLLSLASDVLEGKLVEVVSVEKLKEIIREIAQENECIDKFGDILLRYDVDDVGLFAEAIYQAMKGE